MNTNLHLGVLGNNAVDVPGSHMGTGLCPGYTVLHPSPWLWLENSVGDSPKLWDSALLWEIWKSTGSKLQNGSALDQQMEVIYIYIYRFLCIPAFPVNNKINEKWHLSKKSHVRHPLWHTGLSYFLQTSHRSDDSVSRYSTSSPTPCGCGCEESRTRSKYLGPYHQCERHRWIQFAGNLRSETKNGCLSGPLLL